VGDAERLGTGGENTVAFTRAREVSTRVARTGNRRYTGVDLDVLTQRVLSC